MSFKYNIRRTRNGVQVGVRCYRWRIFSISLVWSILWVLAAVKAYESAWGKNYLGFMSILFCAFVASLGAVIAVNSVLSYALILSPLSGLRLRVSFFGLSTTRSIALSDVNSFGFGHFSHSLIPVLRLELRNPSGRNKWVVLARETTEREVDAFLQDIEGQGFLLPGHR
jgi:hypothetical protein